MEGEGELRRPAGHRPCPLPAQGVGCKGPLRCQPAAGLRHQRTQQSPSVPPGQPDLVEPPAIVRQLGPGPQPRPLLPQGQAAKPPRQRDPLFQFIALLSPLRRFHCYSMPHPGPDARGIPKFALGIPSLWKLNLLFPCFAPSDSV